MLATTCEAERPGRTTTTYGSRLVDALREEFGSHTHEYGIIKRLRCASAGEVSGILRRTSVFPVECLPTLEEVSERAAIESPEELARWYARQMTASANGAAALALVVGVPFLIGTVWAFVAYWPQLKSLLSTGSLS